jgi:hypothetical protein
MMTDLVADISQPPRIIGADRWQGDERNGQAVQVREENRVIAFRRKPGRRIIPRYGGRRVAGLNVRQRRWPHRDRRIPVYGVAERLGPAAPDHFVCRPEHGPSRLVAALVKLLLVVREHPPDQLGSCVTRPAGGENPSGVVNQAQAIGDLPQFAQRLDNGFPQNAELGGVLPGFILIMPLADPFVGHRDKPVEPSAGLLDPDLPENTPGHLGGQVHSGL